MWRVDVKHAEDIQYAIDSLFRNALRSFPEPLVVEHHIPKVRKLRREPIFRAAASNVLLVWRLDVKHAEDIQYAINSLFGNALW